MLGYDFGSELLCRRAQLPCRVCQNILHLCADFALFLCDINLPTADLLDDLDFVSLPESRLLATASGLSVTNKPFY